MFETFKNAWKIPDLKKKLLYTMLMIIIFRVGAAIPVPFTDPSALGNMITSSGGFFGYIDVLTGGAFSQATVFALSVTPYINASIIMQLLTIAIPALERMSKEGEDGRRKINKITRYVTLVLALVLSGGYYYILHRSGALKYTKGFDGVFSAIIIILTFTAGAALMMWLGDRITEKGIGNGISIFIFAGILSRAPSAVMKLAAYFQLAKEGQTKFFFLIPLIVLLFLACIVFIVLMTNAERRIPVQYAKRVVGRKMYGGQSSHIPLKVNMTGVLPIIFASAILSMPAMIKAFFDPNANSWVGKFFGAFDQTSFVYAVLYFLLIIAFNYFYTAVQYNPMEMANNLRKNNGAIPGIRPGKPTSDFISKVLSKITLVGAIFLAIIAIFPILLTRVTGMQIALGGTSAIILVGVALETSKALESQMMMRHYKGFLE